MNAKIFSNLDIFPHDCYFRHKSEYAVKLDTIRTASKNLEHFRNGYRDIFNKLRSYNKTITSFTTAIKKYSVALKLLLDKKKIILDFYKEEDLSLDLLNFDSEYLKIEASISNYLQKLNNLRNQREVELKNKSQVLTKVKTFEKDISKQKRYLSILSSKLNENNRMIYIENLSKIPADYLIENNEDLKNVSYYGLAFICNVSFKKERYVIEKKREIVYKSDTHTWYYLRRNKQSNIVILLKCNEQDTRLIKNYIKTFYNESNNI